MFSHMNTTVDLPGELVIRAEKRAAETRTPPQVLIERPGWDPHHDRLRNQPARVYAPGGTSRARPGALSGLVLITRDPHVALRNFPRLRTCRPE